MYLLDQFVDDSVDFLPDFVENDFITISDPTKKVVRDILSILTLRHGAMFYHPDLGASLYHYQWDDITDTFIERLKIEIKHSLQESMYIKIKDVRVERCKSDKHCLNIMLILTKDNSIDYELFMKFDQVNGLSLIKAVKKITNIIIN